jgi:hypothetical protein
MSKLALAGLATLALSLAAPAVAVANVAPPSAVTQDAELAAKEALVRRYFEVSQFEKMMNSMMEQMIAPMLNNDSIPPEKIPVVREAVLEGFGNVLPQMMEAFVEQYAATFTLEELEQLVAFYESPVGRSIMTKTMVLAREAGGMIERFSPIMEAEMRRQLCARIDCPAPPLQVVPGRR